jgi:hypothetical protein
MFFLLSLGDVFFGRLRADGEVFEGVFWILVGDHGASVGDSLALRRAGGWQCIQQVRHGSFTQQARDRPPAFAGDSLDPLS